MVWGLFYGVEKKKKNGKKQTMKIFCFFRMSGGGECLRFLFLLA
jgi:hypothetical protein